MKKTIATLSLAALLMGTTSAFAGTIQGDKTKATTPAAGTTETKGKGKTKKTKTVKPTPTPAATKTKPSGK